ncbi:metallophosphoesterase family protein [Geminicoccus harenae]|uniref:metallophosphoesterase family protein n=1 Tax=Geminicoccus harenae TaxID=2498453 RepID=UPI00168A5C5E|nr:metallophosphoesterase [Geminicoccus harenae]
MAHARLCIVSDIHCGPETPTKKGNRALELLRPFVDYARIMQPDVLLDLGDRITDVDTPTDRRNLVEVAARLGAVRCERIHLLGNHDVGRMSRTENAEILGVPMKSRVVPLDGCRIVVWQPHVRVEATGLPPAASTLDWLRTALAASDLPAIVVSHVPVSGQSLLGNYYFGRGSNIATYPDHAEVRRVAEESGKVALWLSGHVHWNSLTIVNGIPHVTIQSLTETFTTPPEPSGAYAELEIAGGMFELTVHGRDPFHLRLPFRPSGERRWLGK